MATPAFKIINEKEILESVNLSDSRSFLLWLENKVISAFNHPQLIPYDITIKRESQSVNLQILTDKTILINNVALILPE